MQFTRLKNNTMASYTNPKAAPFADNYNGPAFETVAISQDERQRAFAEAKNTRDTGRNRNSGSNIFGGGEPEAPPPRKQVPKQAAPTQQGQDYFGGGGAWSAPNTQPAARQHGSFGSEAGNLAAVDSKRAAQANKQKNQSAMGSNIFSVGQETENAAPRSKPQQQRAEAPWALHP